MPTSSRSWTIHKAKGLEYPVVYLPFVCSYREPKWGALDIVALADEHGERSLTFDVSDEDRRGAELERQQEDVRLLYVALTRARHALWLGVAPLKAGKAKKCGFSHSAFGYLVSGDETVAEDEIAARLEATFGASPAVRLVTLGAACGTDRGAPVITPAAAGRRARLRGPLRARLVDRQLLGLRARPRARAARRRDGRPRRSRRSC